MDNITLNLIESVIDYGVDNAWNDSDIIDVLVDEFGLSEEDFEKAGFSLFVADYFAANETEDL